MSGPYRRQLHEPMCAPSTASAAPSLRSMLLNPWHFLVLAPLALLAKALARTRASTGGRPWSGELQAAHTQVALPSESTGTATSSAKYISDEKTTICRCAKQANKQGGKRAIEGEKRTRDANKHPGGVHAEV
jgi:hypothetical protein